MNKPLIAIVGPTATGKSQLAVRLAKKFGGEIVSADSWLVRRRLDIGTAKPSLKIRSQIPHHLIDIIDPDENFSAAEYKHLAETTINKLYLNGKLPLIVGGSGLYVDALLYNYSFLPPADINERRQLNAMSLGQLHTLALKKRLDLSLIDKRNKRKVIRLIETNGGIASQSRLRRNSLVIGITMTRAELSNAISRRVDSMLEKGLEAEVSNLVSDYGWDCEALKGIGYHEWKLYFENQQSLKLTRERIIKDTLNLAKRQQTWFKRNKSIHWFTTPVNYKQIDELITSFLNKNITE